MTVITPTELADALESGKYRKAKGRLYQSSTGRQCCLGVACSLAGVPKVFQVDRSAPDTLHPDAYVTFSLAFPWLNYEHQGELMHLNDSQPGYPITYLRSIA